MIPSKVKKFKEISDLRNICMISSGNGQNMALSLEGKVYTWGANLKHELGLRKN